MPEKKTATVQAIPRENYPGYYSGQHFWPDRPVVVEVYDSEDDPEPKHPHRIGQRTWRQMQNEPRHLLLITPGGEFVEAVAETLTIDQRMERLEQFYAQKIAKLEDENAQLRHEHKLDQIDAKAEGKRK